MIICVKARTSIAILRARTLGIINQLESILGQQGILSPSQHHERLMIFWWHSDDANAELSKAAGNH
jgi:hypothetical protein